jgi:hypothetical protein
MNLKSSTNFKLMSSFNTSYKGDQTFYEISEVFWCIKSSQSDAHHVGFTQVFALWKT